MKTIFVTAHDTEVGKTWVCRSLVRALAQGGAKVQYVKPISTGSSLSEAVCDSGYVAQGVASCETHTFYDFSAPLAPVQAAVAEGVSLSLEVFIEKINALPDAEWRVIETAGGMAVPVDASGHDWCDVLKGISADYLVLVVNNRMGAINQARMLHHYAQKAPGIQTGFWLNQKTEEDPIVGRDHWAGLESSLVESLESLYVPIWAKHYHGESMPEWQRGLPLELANVLG